MAFEIEQNPHNERREWISGWERYSIIDVEETENVLLESKLLLEFGLKKLDAIHIAAAATGLADYFTTTDDGILKYASLISSTTVCSPEKFIELIGNHDDTG